MEVVYRWEELESYMIAAKVQPEDAPILLDRFVTGAIEVDVDLVCDGHDVLVAGILEHVEKVGVHSGDSTCSLPAYSLSDAIIQKIREQAKVLALHLKVCGLMNIQFAIQQDQLYVLEANLRASRTIPFISKALGCSFVKVATKCMLGHSLKEQGVELNPQPTRYFVKSPAFPFHRFSGFDTILGPEMRSTGEVMGVGSTFAESFHKSQLALGFDLQTKNTAFISVKDVDKEAVLSLATILSGAGFRLLATSGTAEYLIQHGLVVEIVKKVTQGRPNIVDMIMSGEIDFVLNTTTSQKTSIRDSRSIRTSSVSRGVCLYTTVAGAYAACIGLRDVGRLEVQSLQDILSN